jgi:hypothetical protein
MSTIEISKVEEIVSRVFQQVWNRVPFEHELWNIDNIAQYLKREPATVRERYTCLPSFPKAIRLPNKEGKRSYPLYKAAEVIAWTEKFMERN